LDEASVKLLSVVLFPAEGLPTSPMRGSRGMLGGMRKRLPREEEEEGEEGVEEAKQEQKKKEEQRC
jgi:hypothetical protein